MDRGRRWVPTSRSLSNHGARRTLLPSMTSEAKKLSHGMWRGVQTWFSKKLFSDQLLAKIPKGVTPILHSDMGWQYQHSAWCKRLKDAGVVQSMSRKGNCIDNGATEQVFGHLKDEFFRGRTWPNFESFKADLDAYVMYWNTQRRQVKLKGLTPEEFRNQSLVA